MQIEFTSATLRELSSAVQSGSTAIVSGVRTVLFMVIEHFKDGDPGPVGERFERMGRMLPDGVVYHASWVEPGGARCFQIMEAGNAAMLDAWASRWNDLARLEIVPVLTSQQFWAEFDNRPRD